MKLTTVIFLSLFIFSCSTTSKVNKTAMPAGFDKEGHRGCRGLMPENTIPAMLEAVGLGVTTLEMDIVFTKDGQAILSHEPFFNHEITTKPDGTYIDEKDEKGFNIFNMTYPEVSKYDVGLKPHPRFSKQQKMKVVKPLLSNVIDTVEKYMMTSRRPHPYYNIETKTLPATDNIYHPAPAVFVDRLMKIINEKGIAERVIIQSFDFRTLQYLHEKYPLMKTAMLIEADNKNSFRKQLKDLGFTPTIYSPEFSLVTADLIKNCHDQNIKIIPWTVNDKNKIEDLKRAGVDGVITDYPNLFNE